jgi:hypothetical protein
MQEIVIWNLGEESFSTRAKSISTQLTNRLASTFLVRPALEKGYRASAGHR